MVEHKADEDWKKGIEVFPYLKNEQKIPWRLKEKSKHLIKAFIEETLNQVAFHPIVPSPVGLVHNTDLRCSLSFCRTYITLQLIFGCLEARSLYQLPTLERHRFFKAIFVNWSVYASFDSHFSRLTMSHIAPVLIREASKMFIPEWEHLGQKPRSAHEKIAQPVPFAGGAPEYAKK